MRRFVARLVDCGIPRLTALCICKHFKNEQSLSALEQYIVFVERECYADLAEV